MDDLQALMAEIASVAPTKAHRLSRGMVDGTRVLTIDQARMVLEHLGKCDDVPGAAAPRAAGTRATVVTRQYPQDHPQERAQDRPQDRPRLRHLPPLREFAGIPAGYYATPSLTGTNDLDFWRVRKGTKGQWAGVSFAERVLGGGESGKPRTVELDNIHQRMALQVIQDTGIEAAGKKFADELHHCSACGLPLTDAVSRAYGKGPTCREKTPGR